MIWLVQLVFDCDDPDAITQFWGQALGYRNGLVGASPEDVASFRADHPQFEGRGRIDDLDLRRMPVYIQRVPEAKENRNRLRMEIGVGADELDSITDRLRGLGANPGATSDELRDIEGNEFTVVAGHAAGPPRLRTIVVDALDPPRQLTFWAAATGYAVSDGRCDPSPLGVRWDGESFVLHERRLRHITGMGADAGAATFDLTPGFAFVETDQPKSAKNRLHVDLHSTDVEADRERLVGLGATVLRWDTDQVMADPEGNEFCLSGVPPTPA